MTKSGYRLKTLTASAVKNKRVLVRTDYNVPLKSLLGQPIIADNTRIRATLPTVRFLIQQGAKVIITSHLGRPKGIANPKLSLKPVAKELKKLLKKNVTLIPAPAGPVAEQVVARLRPGEVVLLENNRFDPGEEKNSLTFAKQLAALADVFVNDALAVSHRAHASLVGVTKYLPAFAGLALAEEMQLFTTLMHRPARPFVAIVGGAKISDKVAAIRNLSAIADVVLVGGGVANNFLKADGVKVFHSYLEEKTTGDATKEKISFVSVAEDLLKAIKAEKMLLNGYIPLPKIIYPADVVAADRIEKPTRHQVVNLTNGQQDLPGEQWMFLDIGPKTQKLYRDVVAQAKTVFWNGPMGVFEQPVFSQGTKAVAQAMADSSAKTIVGGGDTIRAVRAFKLEKRMSAISASGGAALEILGGTVLPGIKPLLKKS